MRYELGKYTAHGLGVSSSKKEEYGLVTINEESAIATVFGPGVAHGHKLRFEPNMPVKLLGSVEGIENIERSVVVRFNKLIDQLELPKIDNILGMIEDSPIELNLINSTKSDDELLSIVSVSDLRKQLAKHMMFAKYASEIFNHIKNNTQVEEISVTANLPSGKESGKFTSLDDDLFEESTPDPYAWAKVMYQNIVDKTLAEAAIAKNKPQVINEKLTTTNTGQTSGGRIDTPFIV